MYKPFKAVFITRRGLVLFVVILITAFLVFLGSKIVLSNISLELPSRYVLRATADSSGVFRPVLGWEVEGSYKTATRLLSLLIGVDFSSPAALASGVSGTIIIAPEREPITVVGNEQNKNKQQAPTPSAIAAQKPPRVIERSIPANSGNTDANNISIKNDTDYSININNILNQKKPFKLSSNAPQVLIVHTHTTESYMPSEAYKFTFTATDRTSDPKYNVTKIGEELYENLKKLGVNAIHNKTVHDYPNYTYSYNIALNTIEEELKKNPSIKIVLDIHRDAIIQTDGTRLKLTTQIDNEKVAQVMTVVGTDQLGLKNDNWRTNLKFSVMLQQKLLSLGSGFARPVNLRQERFNGHMAPGAIIIEVGSSGNSLDEAIASAKYIARAVSQVVEDLKN